MKPKTQVLAVRVPEQLKNSMQQLAEKTERSVSYHAQKAIKRYIEEEAQHGPS